MTTDSVAHALHELFVLMKMKTAGLWAQRVEELQLTGTQCWALFAVSRAAEPLGVNELAEQVSVSGPAISRAIDCLVQKDLLSRTEDPQDRRHKRLETTAAGQVIVADLKEHQMGALREVLAVLSEEERAALYTAITPVLARHSSPVRQGVTT